MTHLLGIDGGGSTVRVVICTPDLETMAQVTGETVNPSIVGREEAARRIQAAIHDALAAASLSPGAIGAACAGVAGAASSHSADWLHGVLSSVLPQTRITVSSDYEIALVGAHGKREGVLVLCGTGSLAYGVNAAGETALAGAWGYLIGDEGSGYWLGAQGLRAVARAADGRDQPTTLTAALLDALNLAQPLDLISWLYHSPTPRMREVAGLAPLVLRCAEAGDPIAWQIVEEGAAELALAAKSVLSRLGLPMQQVAFAGSLLRQQNFLSGLLCRKLGLPAIPQPRYSPVMGAALLAKLRA